MKILFFIAIHKRLPVVRQCFDNLANLQKTFNISVFCVCSDIVEAELCSSYDFDFTIEENHPLGRKLNKGLRAAMDLDFTHLIQLGSDDIITADLLNKYVKLSAEDYFGINKFIAVDIENKRAKLWTYGSETQGGLINHPIGAGRVFSKKALKDVLSRTDLWEDERQKVLDGDSDLTMIKNGYRALIVPVEFIGIIDIKTDDNIWGFDEIGGVAFDYEQVKKLIEP